MIMKRFTYLNTHGWNKDAFLNTMNGLDEKNKKLKKENEELKKENQGIQNKVIRLLDFVETKQCVTRTEIKKWWNDDQKAICIYNDLGVLPFTSAPSLCDLLNELNDENEHYKQLFFEIVETALTDKNCREEYCKGVLGVFDKANSLNQAREMIKEHLE